MSFLGGAECSTAANPLNQLTKHTQDEKGFQRDRLVGRAGNGIQGIRSTGGLNMNGTHDQMMNEFMQHSGPLPLEAVAAQHGLQRNQNFQTGTPLPMLNGWAQEFAMGVDTQAQIDTLFQISQATIFNETNPVGVQATKASSTLRFNPTGQQIENSFMSCQSSQHSLGMRNAMGYMPRTQFLPQQSFQRPDKGKAKMIELDDQNWEEQFKQIDLEGRQESQGEAKEIETEINEIDKAVLESETNEFGDFESIWRGIQAEASVTIELEDDHSMGENPDGFGFDDIGTHPPFQDRQLGNYMFEESNLFQDVANPYEEGLRIVEEGGNLSLAALAFEAAVQKEPGHIDAWVMLGSAQAQNEKETPAIRALEQALKLDPTNLTALMGLAVSYTNEGYDSTAYRTLERWLSFKYPAIAALNDSFSIGADVNFTDRLALHEKVTDLFIRAARLSPDGEHMDPDVQVGLGVLFYGAEEYDKAVDCFSAALASTESGSSNQRDQLHLLWNRLGATLANSGRPEEAIAAYEKALTLRANFVRARYNLGVSCINIGCLDEAASHLLGALAMHKVVQNEGRQKAREIFDGSGPLGEVELENIIKQNQSTNLYDTLRRVFNQMERRDLAERVAVDMDVESFRPEFDF